MDQLNRFSDIRQGDEDSLRAPRFQSLQTADARRTDVGRFLGVPRSDPRGVGNLIAPRPSSSRLGIRLGLLVTCEIVERAL